ncbi:MAG: hypothetical protein HYZ16_01880 [Bacteroidetes bacterium]|jgi:uncharacterized protein (UPF0248 family)|nr:hypothetical protein [Bacteroidota bacterium]
METIEQVQKEQVENLKFPREEVLAEKTQKAKRHEMLEKALTLGNLDKFKVKIVFEDDHGMKLVNTTIWGVTERNILLKGDRHIPIHRVHSIEFV